MKSTNIRETVYYIYSSLAGTTANECKMCLLHLEILNWYYTVHTVINLVNSVGIAYWD
jgi:hypothetical protein